MVLLVMALPFLLYLCFVPLPYVPLWDLLPKNSNYKTASVANIDDTAPVSKPPSKQLENPPSIIQAVYATGWSAGTKKYQNYLQSLFATTKVNSVVIDIKDSSGAVTYRTNVKKAKEYKAYWPEILDMEGLVKELHAKGIYVIGRIVVFQDPLLAKARPDLAVYNKSKTKDLSKPVVWQNNGGLSWMDPASSEVWDYNIAIAKEASDFGFDEINFDYVRFPTDGALGNMGFPFWDQKIPKNVIMRNFFQKVRVDLPGVKLSVDIFGQTTTAPDDMGIGQVFEDTLGYFDYVCPMVYPSHYANGFLGYQNPADHPYPIIRFALDSAVARRQAYALANPSPPLRARIRPWLQDFNLGAIYNADMVLQEIQAVQDATGQDFSGYLLWNPSNIYTRGAIIKESSLPQ